MKNFLLTGPPGCGKTSLIKEVLEKLKNVRAGGFFTSEIREEGIRKGFKIGSLDGKEAILAHVDFRGPCKVGKYTVNVENLEKVGELALRKAIEEADLVVIDEIGKMELYSDRMKQAILEALDSKKKVLGTIMKAPHSFADKIKGRKDVKLIEIKKRGQPEVVEELIQAISEAAGKD